MEDLPTELTIDILSRLPVKTIIYCKLVCKKWRDLVLDSSFVNLHLSRSPTRLIIHHKIHDPRMYRWMYAPNEPGILKWVEIEDKVDHHHLHHDPPMSIDLSVLSGYQYSLMYQMGSVNGLICLCMYSPNLKSDQAYICNPVTREYVTLPSKYHGRQGVLEVIYGLGVSSLTGEYKVVRAFQVEILPNSNKPSQLSVLEAEVYTLGTGQWRSLVPVPITYRLERFLEFCGPFLNNHCHWIVSDTEICTFDLDKESFQLLPSPPPPVKENQFHGQSLAILKGCLCKLDTYHSEMTIWVMKEYGSTTLGTKRRTIRWPLYEPIHLIAGLKDGSFLMVFENKLSVFDPRSQTIEDTKMFDPYLSGWAYRPSFLKLLNFEPERSSCAHFVIHDICSEQAYMIKQRQRRESPARNINRLFHRRLTSRVDDQHPLKTFGQDRHPLQACMRVCKKWRNLVLDTTFNFNQSIHGRVITSRVDDRHSLKTSVQDHHPLQACLMKEYGIKNSWHKEVVITEAISKWPDWPFLDYINLIEGLKDVTILLVSEKDGSLFAFYPRNNTIEEIETFDWLEGWLAYRPSFLKLKNFESETYNKLSSDIRRSKMLTGKTLNHKSSKMHPLPTGVTLGFGYITPPPTMTRQRKNYDGVITKQPKKKSISSSSQILILLVQNLNQSIHGRPTNRVDDGYSLKTTRQEHHSLQVCVQEVAEFSFRLFFVNLHLSRSPTVFIIHYNPLRCVSLYSYEGKYRGTLKWLEIEDKVDHHHLHHDPLMNLCLNDSLVSMHPKSRIRLMGSVNGLICLWQYFPNKLTLNDTYICNPITREYIILPRQDFPRDRFGLVLYGFGVSSLSGEYKVVRAFQREMLPNAKNPSQLSLLEAEVYTLGTCQWRSLGPVPVTYRINALQEFYGPFLNNHCHWIIPDSEAAHHKICTFDLHKETFQLFPSPPLESIEENRCHHQGLAILKGCLCKHDTYDSKLIIWVMKEYGIKNSWHKEVVIRLQIGVDQEWMLHVPVHVIAGLKDGSILMVFGCTLCVFDPRSETIEDTKMFFYLELSGLAYHPSFLKLQHFEPERVHRFFLNGFVSAVEAQDSNPVDLANK
ncbi:hypothetical protein OSB04_015857 [Centaurea solstitialis]|uniref:F-box domain-containing protein n=1 Tax=Centaurea solstitialis TaxID=347529 RepID=A0AA38W7W8_9ASTR|nr:hypothetical protein OSB04_015857 [Centaurea solstitialis]